MTNEPEPLPRPFRVEGTGPVLMVDDNPGDIELARLGFVDSAMDNDWMSFDGGKPFLDHLSTVREGGAAMPALVLLDLNMPGMTGFEVLEKARYDPFFHEVPIFCMLTSSNEPRDRAQAERLGTSGFVVKPERVQEYVHFFDLVKG